MIGDPIVVAVEIGTWAGRRRDLGRHLESLRGRGSMFDGWFDLLAFSALALAFGVGIVSLWR
jgi:hypothetical protein